MKINKITNISIIWFMIGLIVASCIFIACLESTDVLYSKDIKELGNVMCNQIGLELESYQIVNVGNYKLPEYTCEKPLQEQYVFD